jgi:hypothetical protein
VLHRRNLAARVSHERPAQTLRPTKIAQPSNARLKRK